MPLRYPSPISPDGKPIASTQEERIREKRSWRRSWEQERSLAIYILHTPRPELITELVRNQVSC